MLGRERMFQIAARALSYSRADQTQVAISVGEASLTRFANSVIHQNVSERNAELGVRAVVGQKIGYAVTNKLDDQSLKAVVDKAVDFARHSAENPDFVSLPMPKPIKDVDTFDVQTAECSPETRASLVAQMIEQGRKKGAVAAGQLSTGYREFAVANSLGVLAYNPTTHVGLTTVMNADTGYGYAYDTALRIKEIDPVQAAIEAAETAVKSMDPQPIEPGEYDVILMPYAVAEFVEFLGYLGLGALAVQEGRSFMKFGQRITGENITIWDDALDERGLPRPFDAEGVPPQRVDMIVNGIANAVVYDSYTAMKEGKESTGHATGGAGTYGPMPMNMFMQPGDVSITDMIASTKKGILVTRFHYTNVIHPVLTVITGMTRDGTFLIENGEVTKPLRNLRFTDSILERLSNVEMISKETRRLDMVVAPAVKARSFRFTGVTEF